jgi:very-short-patch-repair endonuclease
VDQFATASGSGAIKEWLEYCSQHGGQPTPASPSIEAQLAKAQSEFETQVISALATKGVTVRAQYPCCGYSIDCVAELQGSRVAIECDGEIWHLDEHGNLKTEDLLRQEVLERAGWKVLRIPYRSWREDPEMQLGRILDELRNEPPESAEPPQAEPAAPTQTLYIDKFEDALIKALRSGMRSREETFKAARLGLGYSRLGQQIRTALSDALDRLERRKIIRVEEEEAFFRDDEARDASYEIRNAAPSSYVRPRQRRHRRYSRYRRH